MVSRVTTRGQWLTMLTNSWPIAKPCMDLSTKMKMSTSRSTLMKTMLSMKARKVLSSAVVKKEQPEGIRKAKWRDLVQEQLTRPAS